ncbi:uncharacterized protein LOC130771014 [Actinidia eriantha]|uniref:uncharacterized protein LOC130771014 n=1 Tax=Actinidia eriantha TaxID=165200 RepID=UPI002589DC03|nr:uncharacterized protein LOC130771014 [Actinidia eriantha]
MLSLLELNCGHSLAFDVLEHQVDASWKNLSHALSDDDKWQHDLYKDDEPQVSNHRIGTKDLRFKLQKKSIQKAIHSGIGTVSGIRDLRENALIDAPEPETRRVASSVPTKKTLQKAESVDSFLQSLGLEKYSITFQAEEVDMTALLHVTDGDLKALGIPMVNLTKVTLLD